MIHIEFDPGQLTGSKREWWDTWVERARAATDSLLEKYRHDGTVEFEAQIWADLRVWMFDNVFHRKCAYCEAKVSAHSWGAAEHWRPKGAVTVKEDGVSRRIDREGQDHPGYFWLAYDWQNIVPSCDLCNAGKGKGTQFPIEGEYVFDPEHGQTFEDLNEREEPLLLHPFDGGERDPALHLWFDENGIPFAHKESKYGNATIAVFDLDRDDLNDERRSHFQYLNIAVQNAVIKAAMGLESVATYLEHHGEAHGPYSLASRDYIRLYLPRVLARLDGTDLWSRSPGGR
jgi:hypothetical protein